MDTASKIVGGTVLFVAAIIAAAIVNGLILAQLWSWFVVRWFHLRPLSIPEALGIALLVGYLTKNYTTSKSDEDSTRKSASYRVAEVFLKAFGVALMTLVAGWIYHNAL